MPQVIVLFEGPKHADHGDGTKAWMNKVCHEGSSTSNYWAEKKMLACQDRGYSEGKGKTLEKGEKRLPLTTLDHPWPPLTTFDHPWPSLTTFDYLWPPLTIFAHTWPPLTTLDHPWPPLTTFDHPWPPLTTFGHHWLPLATLDHPLDSPVFHFRI